MKCQGRNLSAEAQRFAESRRGFLLSALLRVPLRLCVATGLALVPTWPRYVPALKLPLALALGLLSQLGGAQESSSLDTLPQNRYRNGEETLRAFAPISAATR